MNRHGRLWFAIPGVVVLMAVHGVIMSYIPSHVVASAALAGALVAVIVLKHIGLLGSLYGVLRKTCRRR